MNDRGQIFKMNPGEGTESMDIIKKECAMESLKNCEHFAIITIKNNTTTTNVSVNSTNVPFIMRALIKTGNEFMDALFASKESTGEKPLE